MAGRNPPRYLGSYNFIESGMGWFGFRVDNFMALDVADQKPAARL